MPSSLFATQGKSLLISDSLRIRRGKCEKIALALLAFIFVATTSNASSDRAGAEIPRIAVHSQDKSLFKEAVASALLQKIKNGEL